MSKVNLKGNPFYLDDEQINWVEKTLEGMDVRQKVGQLFCVSPALDNEESVKTQMNSRPCGLMLRPYDTEICVDVVNRLNEQADIPLLVAADLEKGGNGVSNDGTVLGSPLGIAATDDTEYAKALGTICAREGAAVGVNWTFGPIVDIDTNFLNPITNVRTFGSNKKRVAEMGVAYIQAAQSLGVAATAKHFPGDGVDFRDQHIVGTTNSLSVEEWDAGYGEVYRACIDAGVKSIMVGHIFQPSWTRKINPDIADEDILPASMSPEMIQGVLRGHLNFNGVVVTDATTMTGFMQALPRPRLIPQVIASGVDMILFSLNIDKDIEYMMEAVSGGVITKERLDEAVIRILALKASLNLHKKVPVIDLAEAKKIIGCKEHRTWELECADKSITLVKKEDGVLPLTKDKYKRMLFVPLEGKPDEFAHNRIRSGATLIMADLLRKEGFELTVLETGSEVYNNLRLYEYMVEHFDVILYCANYGTTSNQTVVRLLWPGNNMGWCPNYVHSIPTVFVSLENPYHLLDVPRVKTFINCYSPTDTTIKSVVEKLMGRSEFKGVSPVDPFCGLWDAKL